MASLVPSTEGNNVWAMIQGIGDTIIRYRQAKHAPAPQTTASPSGTLSMPNANPFPGFFSTTPQADTKVDHDAPGGMIFGMNPLMLVAALLGVLLFLRLSR